MAEPLLKLRDLVVEFAVKRRLRVRSRGTIQAVRGIDMSISSNKTLGLVGESGSGKSTTGRAALGLVSPTHGSVFFRGHDLAQTERKLRHQFRSEMQMVVQNPYSSLDPAMPVGKIVREPLDIHRTASREARNELVDDALREVGLSVSDRHRYPREFSGGQLQRIAIARAIVSRPAFIVFDEAVSALDVLTKEQIIMLIKKLQSVVGAAYLVISHDLSAVRRMADRVAVMYAGKIVEEGPTERVYNSPAHPYTQALLSSVPSLHRRRDSTRERILLKGEPPSPIRIPPGCAFHPRCPFAMEICSQEQPALSPVQAGGSVACHLQTSGPKLAGGTLANIRSSLNWGATVEANSGVQVR